MPDVRKTRLIARLCMFGAMLNAVFFIVYPTDKWLYALSASLCAISYLINTAAIRRFELFNIGQGLAIAGWLDVGIRSGFIAWWMGSCNGFEFPASMYHSAPYLIKQLAVKSNHPFIWEVRL